MLACLMALSYQVLAGSKDNASDGSDSSTAKQQGNDIDLTKPHLISIEDSMRLRQDLDEYSRTVDPAHVQIEERRRMMHRRVQERFNDSDRDNDGSISRDEAADSLPQVARHFNQVDLNGDGLITLDELEALQARILGQRPTIKIDVPVTTADTDSKLKPKNKDAMVTTKKRSL